MKLSLTLTTVLLGLAAAAPGSDPSTEGLSKDLEQQVKKNLAELEEINKKSIPGTIQDMAKQLGWQAAGNLPGKIGQGATILSLLATSDYTVSPENGKAWVKNLGGAALSFLPKVGTLGNLPGFIGMIKTIAIGIERAQFPELTAKREAEAKCFSSNADRTYKDLCQNCPTHLTISLLGRLNGCSDKPVVGRDAHLDDARVKGFCLDAVLCDGYNNGGPSKVITQGARYDPLRSFWCKEKDEQVGMLLHDWLGGPLSESLYMLDAEDFRNALAPSCKKLLRDDKIEAKCPSREEREEADKMAPPISYCAPGKSRDPNYVAPGRR